MGPRVQGPKALAVPMAHRGLLHEISMSSVRQYPRAGIDLGYCFGVVDSDRGNDDVDNLHQSNDEIRVHVKWEAINQGPSFSLSRASTAYSIYSSKVSNIKRDGKRRCPTGQYEITPAFLSIAFG